jgi:hypothetical protein
MKKIFNLAITFLILNTLCFASDPRGINIVSSSHSKSSSLGCYYAYIIGINAYGEGWTNLQTAVKDARELREVLVTKYDFEPERVFLRIDEEATQYNVINDLKYLASNLKEHDNLLIYYAGHGQLEEFLGDGYWIPVDGKPKNPGTWLSHSSIRNILSSEMLKAKNIALISDSCYSGALLRSGPSSLPITDQDYSQKIVGLSSLRSRQVFTSGGVEPVADGGRDGHSLFAYYFIKALKDNRLDFIDIENLFYSYVWKPVAEIGDQRPYVGRLKSIMDDNGQFVLLLRSARDKVPDRSLDLEQASVQPPVFSHPTIQGKRKLAIFPFFLEKSTGYRTSEIANIDYFLKNIISILDDIFKEDNAFVPIYSYYNMKKVINKIPEQIIAEESMKHLWVTSWNSVDKKPDLDLLCELGNQLKVDLILTYWLYISGTDMILKAFLIDVKNKKLTEKIEQQRDSSIYISINNSFKIYAMTVTLDILKE